MISNAKGHLNRWPLAFITPVQKIANDLTVRRWVEALIYFALPYTTDFSLHKLLTVVSMKKIIGRCRCCCVLQMRIKCLHDSADNQNPSMGGFIEKRCQKKQLLALCAYIFTVTIASQALALESPAAHRIGKGGFSICMFSTL